MHSYFLSILLYLFLLVGGILLLAPTIHGNEISHHYTLLIGYLSNDNLTVWSLDSNTGSILNNTDLNPSFQSDNTGNSISAGIYAAWMTVSPDNRHIYIANHNTPGGAVTILQMVNQSRSSFPVSLTVQNTIYQTPPANPVHMSTVDNALFTVSYNDFSFTTYTINPSTSTLTLSMNRIAACANAHQIILVPAPWSADSHSVLVPCLGDDSILNFVQGDLCSSTNKGQVCSKNLAYSRKGSGPRHLVKHPYRNIIYVMNEKDSSIATWLWDPQEGQMFNPVYLSSLPVNASFAGNSSYWAGAEIALSNDAQYLYVSNRALSSNLSSTIGVFKIDSNTGAVLPNALQFTDGDGDVNFPRHFTLTPDNRYLLVANQKGKSVTVFSVDAANTGLLTKLQTYQTPGTNPGFILVVPHTYPPNPVVSGSHSLFHGGGGDSASYYFLYLLLVAVGMLNLLGVVY